MEATEERVEVQTISAADGWSVLEAAAQKHLGMGADEFIRTWDGGGFDGSSDSPNVMRVAMLLPLGRQGSR
jgi:hypothetical protein